jgi:hypothetical protein
MAHLAIVAPARPSADGDFGLDHHLTPARSNPALRSTPRRSSWSKIRVTSRIVAGLPRPSSR